MILLEASLRISAVAAIAAVVLTLMRVRTGGVRHAVWTLVVVAMLLMPILPSMVPAFEVDVPSAVSVIPADVLPRFGAAETFQQTIVETRPAAPISPPASSFDSDRPIVAARSSWSLWQIASTAYVIGVIVLLLRLIAGWYAAVRLTRGASPVSNLCDARVRESALVATPITAGVLVPTILLPAGWPAWPAEKLNACLAHELAHIHRRDPFVAFIAHVNRCIFWFHPLAWWLEHTLAVSAEDAADEAAVRAIGNRRRYAEVLLDIAEAVRLRGARVAWQGIGAGGTGRLGRRVDRVLSGETSREISRARKVAVFAACVAAVVIAVACRQQQTVSALQPDPGVAARLQQQKADQALRESVRNLSAAEVDALEKSLKGTADDLETLRKLRTFYQASGQKVFGWNEMIARRRPHILWLIENHPDHEMDVWQVSAEADPVGYAEAKKRWLAQTAKPDASVRVLSNAAYFLERADAPLAEQLLLRAKAMNTDTDHARAASMRLGSFYARVLDPRNGAPFPRIDSSPYLREVRQRLAESNDALLLSTAGGQLAQTYGDEDRRQLGRHLLERALQIDPQQMRARRVLATLDTQERSRLLNVRLRRRAAALAGGAITAKQISRESLTPQERAKVDEMEPQAASELSDYERFVMLPELAYMAHMRGVSSWSTDRAASDASFAHSKKYAQEALALAPTFRNDPDYGRVVYHATVTLAVHALREGNRNEAVRHMLEAVNAPASPGLEAYSYGLEGRLVNDLLKLGERETVAEFLERSAGLRPAAREYLLRDAAAIRAGKMPESFQYMVSR